MDQPVAGEAQVVPEQEQSEEDQDNGELRVCGCLRFFCKDF